VDLEKREAAHQLEKEVFIEDVKPPPVTWTYEFGDRDAPILEEMKQYEMEAIYVKQSFANLDPIAYWSTRAA
jgi:hypothetical protein